MRRLNGISKPSLRKFVFPGILVFLFLVLVALGINGSSLGIYHDFVGGKGPDKNLLLGVPRSVRGDEWLVITPMTVSQQVNGYPVINRDIGNGQDMTVILDAPVRDWSTALRPWNWGFFFLPLKNAFAFKWWAMLVALGMAAYLLALRLFPRRYLLASLVSIFVMASPFVQWWYREYTAGLLAFGLGSLAAMLAIHEAGSRRRKIVLSALLAYLLAGFIFIQYPPFEILLALSVGLFYIGYIANLLTGKDMDRPKRMAVLKDIGLVFAAALVAVAVIGVFFLEHSGALKALAHTTYPGHRIYASGQGTSLTLAHLFSSNTMFFLQRSTKATQTYYYNQSEASLFIQYSLILLLPVAMVIYKNVRSRKAINWLLVTLPAGMILVYAYWFIPGLTNLFRPILFQKVPVNRFEMMLGVLDLFLLLVLAKEFPKAFNRRKTRYMLGSLTAATALIVFLLADFYLRSHFPGLLGVKLVVLSAAWMSAALFLILAGKKEAGLAMLVVLSVVSVFRVNPLYRGLEPLTGTPLANYIRTTSKRDPAARWITTDKLFEGYLPANGARSISGDYSYPQLSLWKQIDDDPAAFPAYNRPLHVEALIDTRDYVELHATSDLYIHLDPCSKLVKKLNLKYLVTSQPQANRCLVPQKRFDNSAAQVYRFQPL